VFVSLSVFTEEGKMMVIRWGRVHYILHWPRRQ